MPRRYHVEVFLKSGATFWRDVDHADIEKVETGSSVFFSNDDGSVDGYVAASAIEAVIIDDRRPSEGAEEGGL